MSVFRVLIDIVLAGAIVFFACGLLGASSAVTAVLVFCGVVIAAALSVIQYRNDARETSRDDSDD